MNVRFAVPEDAPALLEIYRAYIGTGITFEYELPSREEFARRIASVRAVYPYLVLEDEGRAAGYAYAHRLAERAAYGWSAELSIYLRPEMRGRGAGTRLYRLLIELLRRQGIRTVYGLVTSPNPASEALHEKLGFRLVGVQQNVGHKSGQWLGMSCFELALGPYDGPPGPVIPAGQLPEEEVRRLLAAF